MKNFTYMFWFLAVSVISLTSCSKDSLGEELETAELNTGVPAVSYSSFEMNVLELINAYRGENGLSELKVLDDGSRQAKLHNNHKFAMMDSQTGILPLLMQLMPRR